MRPSWTNPCGWNPRTPASHGSRPEYEVSICPLNINAGPPPAPSQSPTTLGRPSSTSCHCTWRPMSASSSRTRSPIACSSPVGLEIDTSSTASCTSRSASISTEMRQHLPPEKLDLLVSPLAPELEDHVRDDALRRQPPSALHRLGDRTDLVL